MPVKTAWLGEQGLTDIGYQLFEDGTPYGARITTAISDIGDGWYAADVNYDNTTFSGYIQWNSISHPEAEVREYVFTNDTDPDLNVIKINVTDAITSKPIPHAVIRASNSTYTLTTKTDSSGAARIALFNDSYVVSVIKNDYAYISRNIDVEEDQDVVFQIYPITADINTIRLAEQIWRDAQLPIETFSFQTEDDAIQWVTTTILPETEAYVDSKINAAVMPYTFPIDIRIVVQAYPTHTYTQVSLLSQSWESTRKNVIRFLALYRMFLLADSIKKEYLAKAEAFRRAGEESLSALIQTLTGVIISITSGGKKFGFVHLKLAKRRRKDNEYSWN